MQRSTNIKSFDILAFARKNLIIKVIHITFIMPVKKNLLRKPAITLKALDFVTSVPLSTFRN